MANRTVKYAVQIHGKNPQLLIDYIVRKRIYECKYWKEHCTLLTSALVLEKAVDDLRYVAGSFGVNTKPTQFLCLVLKLLQIQPNEEIIHFLIDQSEFKYLRALAAFYYRLVGKTCDIYRKLEPLLGDYRKLRTMSKDGKFSVIHMDEFIDNLLEDERVCDIALPRMMKRSVLESNGDTGPYDPLLPSDDKDLIKGRILEKTKAASKEHDTTEEQVEPQYSRRDYRDSANNRPKGESMFSQRQIDEENSIRAKVGLCPLKW